MHAYLECQEYSKNSPMLKKLPVLKKVTRVYALTLTDKFTIANNIMNSTYLKERILTK